MRSQLDFPMDCTYILLSAEDGELSTGLTGKRS
jgi:hypothetical protein